MSIEKTIRKILNKIKHNKTRRETSNIKKISYDELEELMRNNSELIIVDTRSPQEYAENRIRYAINIPVYEIEKSASFLLPNKDKVIVLYCQCGIRSDKAYKILEEKGYTNLYTLEGGIDSI